MIKRKNNRVSFPLHLRLVLIILTINLTALGSIISLASLFFLKDTEIRVDENNQNIVGMTARLMEKNLSVLSNSSLMLLLGMGTAEPGEAEAYEEYFFANNPEIVYVGILDSKLQYFNDAYIYSRKLSRNFIRDTVGRKRGYAERALEDEPMVFAASAGRKELLTGIVVPYRQERELRALFILASLETEFRDIVSSEGRNVSYMINGEGEVILHSRKGALAGETAMEQDYIREILNSPFGTIQIRRREGDEGYLCAADRVDFGDLTVVTEISEGEAFEAVYAIERRNRIIFAMVLTLVVLVVYFTSKTVARPILSLAGIAGQVEVGNYEVPIASRRRDEIGLLYDSFSKMAKGLKEREQIKDAFGRFVNEDVVEQAARGALTLGGEMKSAAVFFSDIRSFTAISENLEPTEVVEFLNQYMTRMVDCVVETGGVVDKFIGDAIMALWGLPLSHGNDVENAVDGALRMRRALLEFNIGRGSPKRPVIRIGCGISYGPLISGQIGSVSRMEYTVIGDTVNLASRIESLNKSLGTDILISEEAYKRVEGLFRVVPMERIRVKGKSEAIKIYAVLGRREDEAAPRSLEELRTLVGIEIPASLTGLAASSRILREGQVLR